MQETKPEVETREKPNFGRTVIDDFRRGDFRVTMKRDWEDVIQFYIDEDDLRRLDDMGSFKRSLFSTGFLLRGMFYKLTPARRIMLLISLVLFLDGIGEMSWTVVASFLGLLSILVLELKDKLLAQDELQSGRAVQLALMPDRSPKFPGWDIWLFTEPANDVGGDLVDYMHLGSDRLAIALGDVAGKGLPAALFMAKLQATLRAIAPAADSPSHLASAINDIFWRDKLPNRFASLLYAEVESDDGTIRLVNAGHLPPAHMTTRDVKIMPAAGGTAIGLVNGVEYDEQAVRLEKGDAIVIYSDGVSEARNLDGGFFGEARLLDLLDGMRGQSATAIGSAIVGTVDDFVGSARPSDDLSVVVIRRSS